MSRHEGWILGLNLRPCLELLASVGETELEADIMEAFEGALSNTDVDTDRWYELPLGRLGVNIAAEESGLVFLRIEAPHGYGRAVEAVIRACATYLLQDAYSRAEAKAAHP